MSVLQRIMIYTCIKIAVEHSFDLNCIYFKNYSDKKTFESSLKYDSKYFDARIHLLTLFIVYEVSQLITSHYKFDYSRILQISKNLKLKKKKKSSNLYKQLFIKNFNKIQFRKTSGTHNNQSLQLLANLKNKLHTKLEINTLYSFIPPD